MTKQKERARGGFTLVEVLCAIVVLLLVSGLMVVGIRTAVKAYNTEVMHSEAQVLCSTIRTKVNDELRYAGTVETKGSTISFFSQNYGKSVFYSSNEEGQIMLGENKILPSKSYPYSMRAEVEIKSYDTESRIFTVHVKVTQENESSVLAETDFQVKKLNETAASDE